MYACVYIYAGVTPGIVDYGVENSDPLRSHLVVLQLLAVRLS